MTAVGVRGGWAATGWDDPAPGRVDAARGLADRFQRRSDDLLALSLELTQGLQGLEAWRGAAAGDFARSRQHLRAGLDVFVERFDECASAMSCYASDLAARRSEAASLLPRVLDAQNQLREANRLVLHGPSLEARWNAYYRAQGLIVLLGKLGLQWEGISAAHLADVSRCGHRLQNSDGTPIGDLWRHAGSVLETGKQRLGELTADADRWLRENANAIAAVSDVLGDVGFIVGLLPIPGAQAVGVGLSAASFAGKVVARHYGADVTDEELMWSAAGVLVGGVALAKGARLARYAAKAEKLEKALFVGEKAKKLNDGQNPFEYWTPRNPVQVGVYANAALGGPPASALVVPFWNAIESGHAEDVKARAARETVPAGGAAR